MIVPPESAFCPPGLSIPRKKPKSTRSRTLICVIVGIRCPSFPSGYPRAYHILDALLKGMLPFGASVTNQFHFQVNGEDVPFTISESKDEIPHVITQAEKN